MLRVLAALTLVAPQAMPQTADLVVTNACIYSMDATHPRALALAVKGTSILAIANDVSKHIGPSTRLIDARGAAMIPGLIDAHVHMRNYGESLMMLDLRETKTVGEAAQMVREAAAKSRPGQWIRGRGWDQTRWPGGEFPTSAPLDQAAPNNPVYLTRVDGHAAWVNRKALDLAGVYDAAKDPPGGRVLRARDGKPSGVLVDRAMGLVASKIPELTDSEVEARLARAARECARLGLTTVHDAGVSAQDLRAYRALIAKGKLPVRVYAMIGGDGDLWREYLKKGPEVGEFLTVRSIKLVADGALGSRGAAMKEPYSDEPGNRGLLILRREQIEGVARDAIKRGFQVNTHAIGDRANREVIDAYAAALGGKNDKRFRIEHAQVVSLEDIPLFAKYSILPSMQATHATSDMRWAEKRVGPERVKGAYAWQRFLKLGLPVANGSDFPVEEPNPVWGFYAAITRQDRAGWPAGGWMPDQKMSREQAQKSWTLDAAYAAFEEKSKGSLAPGKLADFVLLSDDIMQAPPPNVWRVRVTLTVLGGRVVHQEGR